MLFKRNKNTSVRLSYPDKLWILLALIMILVNEWTSGHDWARTPLFDPIQIMGLNISPIEIAILLAITPLLPKIFIRLVARHMVRHPMLSALTIGAFSMGMITGYERLGSIVGLVEIKSFFFLGVFTYLSCQAIKGGLFKRIVPLLSIACIAQSLISIFQFLTNPIVNANLGEQTDVNFLPCLLLPVFVARLMNQNEHAKFKYQFCIAIVLINLYLSQSRSAMVIALSGVFLTAAFCRMQRNRPLYPMGRFIPSAGLFTLVLLLVVGIILSNTEFVRSFVFWEDQANQGHNASNLGHYFDILRGIQIIAERPITGMGFGGNLPALGTATFDVIHNEFLHFWVFFGIGGAFLWLYLFVVMPVKSIRRLDNARLRGFPIQDQHYLIFSMLSWSVAHFLVDPSFHQFFPQVWFMGLYLASLGTSPSTDFGMVTSRFRKEQTMLPLGSQV